MEKRVDFANYQQAMAYAKEYAKNHSQTAKLVRNGEQWTVVHKENIPSKQKFNLNHDMQFLHHFSAKNFYTDGEQYCDTCDTPIGSSGECYNCEID